MVIVKLLTTLIIQMDAWENVKDFVLSPFANPKIELIVVMLIIPFVVNILIFWVTDNFLMRHTKSKINPNRPGSRRGQSILEKVKVKYRTIKKPSGKKNESESEALITSDDEELILGTSQVDETPRALQQRTSTSTAAIIIA